MALFLILIECFFFYRNMWINYFFSQYLTIFFLIFKLQSISVFHIWFENFLIKIMQQICSAQIKMQEVQLTIQYIILSKYISNWNKKASSGTEHFYDVGRQDYENLHSSWWLSISKHKDRNIHQQCIKLSVMFDYWLKDHFFKKY